jgi:hypothetical protein
LRPEVERFLGRVVVPALVNRYIKELKGWWCPHS